MRAARVRTGTAAGDRADAPRAEGGGGSVTSFKVVIADPPGADHTVEDAAFAASGLHLELVWPATRDVDGVLEHAADADALVMSWVPLTRQVIDQLRRCRVIARFGIGVDMIDLDA